MKYVSIDIETTGLDPYWHDLLEIGIVLDELFVSNPQPVDQLPTLRIITPDPLDLYCTSAYCASMHAELWHLLKMMDLTELDERIAEWSEYVRTLGEIEYCKENGYPLMPELTPNHLPAVRMKTGEFVTYPAHAGVVIRSFLQSWQYNPDKIIAAGKNVAGFDLPFLEEHLDPMINFRHRTLDPAILYMEPGDEAPPNLSLCKERAGMENTTVAHEALQDAKDVCHVLRHKLC